MTAPRARQRKTGKRGAPTVRRGTLRLPGDVVRRIRLGHPWVYREALDQRRDRRDQPGDLVELVDEGGDFIAHGFIDGDTAIAIRVVSRKEKERITADLFRENLRSALALRRRYIDFSEYEAIRLVNGEADGFPAISVDRYGDYLVTQLFTPAVERFRDWIYDALVAELSPQAIYEQRRYRSLAGEAPRTGAELVRGAPAPVEIEVREGRLRFAVDVTAPLSTGLFADLREGRRAVGEWAKDRRVLNLFSYTGALSLYAQAGGAKEVVAVDVSAKSHARARKNLSLSGFDPEGAELITADAMKTLARFAERKRRFDMVVIDPPAFASGTRGGKPWTAVRDYSELCTACLNVLDPGGLLVAASSTHRLTWSDFDLALAEGAADAGTRLRIIDRRSLPIDFPTSPGFPEGDYLKFAVSTRD